MKKRVYRYKLKKQPRKVLAKLLITLLIFIIDLVIYHYLGVLGAQASENAFASTVCMVGWFWLLAGQFGVLYGMWG